MNARKRHPMTLPFTDDELRAALYGHELARHGGTGGGGRAAGTGHAHAGLAGQATPAPLPLARLQGGGPAQAMRMSCSLVHASKILT